MRVFQMVVSNACHPHFEEDLIDGLYHAYLGYAGPRTVCGIQLPHEIGAAMAFPSDYVVLGTKRQQVKQYGNAVTPPVMRMIFERCIATLN